MIEFIAEFIAAPEVHSSAYVMHIHVNRHVDTYFPCRLHDFKERGNVPGVVPRSLEFRERVPSLPEDSPRKEGIPATNASYITLHDHRTILLRFSNFSLTNNNNKSDD